jgi:hypothetical protein
MAVLCVAPLAGEVIVGDDNDTARQIGDLVSLRPEPRHVHLFDAGGRAF